MENLIIFLQSYILEMLIIFTGIVAVYGWVTRNKLIELADRLNKIGELRDKQIDLLTDMVELSANKIVELEGRVEAFRCGIEVLRKDLDDHITHSKDPMAKAPEPKCVPATEYLTTYGVPKLPSGSFKPGGVVYEAVHEFVRTHRGLNPMLVTDMVHVTQYTEQQCNKAVSEMIKRGLIVTEGNRRSRKLFPAIN